MNNELFIGLVIIALIIPFISTFSLNYWLSSKNKWVWINWITSTILILINAGLTILFTCLLNDNLAIILSAFIWSFNLGIITSGILYKKGIITYKKFSRKEVKHE